MMNETMSKSRASTTSTTASTAISSRNPRIRQRTHAAVTDEESQIPTTATVVPPSPDSPTGRKRNVNAHRAFPASLASLLPSLFLPRSQQVSSSSSSYRQWCMVLTKYCLDAENWKRAWAWAKRNKRLVQCLIISIPFILRPSRLWKWRYDYFGKYNIQGGILGERVEKWSNLARYDEVHARQQAFMDSLGVVLPPGIPPDRSSFHVLKLDTQAALREMLVRREQRAQTLARLEVGAQSSCNSSDCAIPRVIFVPDGFTSWQPPRPGKSKRFQQLSFDEREMRQLIQDTRPGLLPLFDMLEPNDVDRIYLFAVCAVYYFGGVFVGNGALSAVSSKEVDSLLWSQKNPISHRHDGAHLAIAVVDPKQEQIYAVASTPRNPALLCSIGKWELMMKSKRISGFKQHDRLTAELLPKINVDHTGVWTKWILKEARSNTNEMLAFEQDSAESSPILACDFDQGSWLTNAISFDGSFVGAETEKSEFYALYLDVKQTNKTKGKAIAVSIEEQAPPLPAKVTQKVTLGSQLNKQGSEPGWFCMRCMKMSHYGRMDRCTRFCPSGYTDLICHGPDIPEKKQVDMQLTVSGSYGNFQSGSAIPKVIHQTWFEDVNPDRYPQLARLQNSWKNSGWTYRLYTDETARAYIEKHFPQRFVGAFDALIPGAFKADLFRYLVLLREGGVYADVDILLETNLDRFLSPSISFFAPRDVVLEFAGEPFCLWNGLIGAAPGHPFIVRAVERLINLIMDRADIYDMERDLCRDGKEFLDVWKVRLQTLLLLSGPCGLGVAVNEAMGKPSLQKIETGWTGLDDLEFGGKKDHGDALIMVVDKHDIGGFRISDPERNLIVASTNMDNVEKHAREISNPTKAEQKRQQQRKLKELVHYSNSNRVNVWGSEGVYSDKMVTSERIKIHTHYETGRTEA